MTWPDLPDPVSPSTATWCEFPVDLIWNGTRLLSRERKTELDWPAVPRNESNTGQKWTMSDARIRIARFEVQSEMG